MAYASVQQDRPRSREDESREYVERMRELSARLSRDRNAALDFLKRAGILTQSGEFNPAYDEAPGYKRRKAT